jgi:predicted Zn-dependent protease
MKNKSQAVHSLRKRPLFAFWRSIFMGAFCCLFLTACDTSPTGRRQLTLLPEEQVNAIGEQSFTTIKRKAEIETNTLLNAYIGCVARALLDEASGEPSQWEIAVFRDPSPNAFALPGGKIGINTGLLKVAANEDQLAAVIGHEVGHVLANHSNERLSQEFAVDTILSLIAMFFGDESKIGDDFVIAALGLGAQFGVLLPFSRTHESESDTIGLELMARAGFDPRQNISLWRNMEHTSERQPLEFLSTHPSHDTRMEDLNAQMDTALRLYESARAQGKRPSCGRS